MMKVAVLAGFLALAAAKVEWQGQDVTNFYEGWFHAVGLESSFTDKIETMVSQAKQEMQAMDLHKPVMSLLETGAAGMSESTQQKVLDLLQPIAEGLEAVEYEATAARASMGFSFGGLGLPRPNHPAAVALWNAIGGGEEEKGPGAFSLLESSSSVEAGVKKMRSSQGKQTLQLADAMTAKLEQDAKKADEAMRTMMDKLMVMTMEERKPLLKEYEQLKLQAKIAKQAHEWLAADSDTLYQTMAQYPDERTMDQETVVVDNAIENEFEELLRDPKMQSMLQMEEKPAVSFLETGVSAEATQMMSVEITAKGRVGNTGVDEEGSEEQGAAQAAELLKMFDVHVGHYGSAPPSLTSFIQTHDQLSEQQREAAQAKALLQRRVSQAMSRSAQIDKLLDDAIMDYLSNPTKVEEKPTVLEEIAGAFRSNADPLSLFAEHPFVARYRSDQLANAVLPPRPIQRQLIDNLLKDAPGSMKMAVIHADLDAPGARELKIQQDLVCMKKYLQMMKKSDDGELRIFVDIQGGRARDASHVTKEVEQALASVNKVRELKQLGSKETQDYATGLADFVFRVGEGQLTAPRNKDLAAFKVEALKRGGVIKADVSKAPADMCTLDGLNLQEAATAASKKFAAIKKVALKVDQKKKEQKMLSETEQWAAQQRRVEHNHKRHGKAFADVDFKPQEVVRGFANFLSRGSRTQEQAKKAALYETDSRATPKARRGPNYGLYKSRQA